MRPADPAPRPTNEAPTDEAYVAELVQLTRPFGVSHTGVAPATVMQRAREALHHRIDHGLHDGMRFTFKNPERSTDPQQAVRGARSLFVAARPYLLDDPAPGAPTGAAPEPPMGRVARYAWVDHYAPLRKALSLVAQRLRADGFAAVAFADDNSIVDREAAYLAGLGWYGKNANLLLPGAGSWFVLGCVVTTAALPVAAAPVGDGCGGCRRCLDACPTAAIVAPGVIDGSRCLAWVLQKPGPIPRELRALVGNRIYGCDDCQEVCPPVVRFGPHHRVSSVATAAEFDGVRSQVSVLALLTGSDDEVLALWGQWYLAGRDPRWVRRNALVVLGNVADPSSPAVRAVLADYGAHHDPLLRAHAVWAIRRLGLVGLLPDSDPDPDVLAELQAP